MAVDPKCYEFIVEDLYKKTEGGYSHVAGDPETYLSNTITEWKHVLPRLSNEQRAAFPQKYQPLLNRIAHTTDDNERTRIASQLMQEAGRLLKPFGGGGQPDHGEPKRSPYQPLPNLSADGQKLLKAMESVAVEHTYDKYFHGPGLDQYPECVRWKMVTSCVNGGALRAKAQLVGAMYEANLITSQEYAKLHIPSEALASRKPFEVDKDPYRQHMYTTDALDKMLLPRLQNLPQATQVLLHNRFAIMRHDFHQDLIEGSPNKAKFADGWHNSTFSTDRWQKPEGYSSHNPNHFVELRTPEAQYNTVPGPRDEVRIRLEKDIVLRYYVDDATHRIQAFGPVPKGMRVLQPGQKYDPHQHPGPEAISNPYPNEVTAVFISPDSQKPYFIPLSRLANQLYPVSHVDPGMISNMINYFAQKPVIGKATGVTLEPVSGNFVVDGYHGPADSHNHINVFEHAAAPRRVTAPQPAPHVQPHPAAHAPAVAPAKPAHAAPPAEHAHATHPAPTPHTAKPAPKPAHPDKPDHAHPPVHHDAHPAKPAPAKPTKPDHAHPPVHHDAHPAKPAPAKPAKPVQGHPAIVHHAEHQDHHTIKAPVTPHAHPPTHDKPARKH